MENKDLELKFGEAVEVVYDAVMDRSRFDELITLALKVSTDEGRRSEFQALRDALDPHVLTAEKLLHNMPKEQAEADSKPVISVDSRGCIQEANEISTSLLGIEIGNLLGDLIESDSSNVLTKGALPQVLRMKRLDSGKSYIMVAQSEGGNEGIRTYTGAEIPWDSDASTVIGLIYNLTKSEAHIMGLLVSGYSPVEIADYRGRSIETVRQQIKTIYSKTTCKGLPELLQLAQAVLLSTNNSKALPDKDAAPARHSHIILQDGRRMDYSSQGAEHGSNILFLHGCLCGNLFLNKTSDYLQSRKVRVISPARPGHGNSTGNDVLLDDPSQYADDLLSLMDHLDIGDVHLIGFDIGAIFALCVASRLGRRLKSLTCISAHPPIRSYRDIAAMPQQQRIFTILPKVSIPLLRFLAKTGDRKLKREGLRAFPKTVFAEAEADLKACEDPETLQLFWAGHHFHVKHDSDGFISDCRLAASQWINNFQPPLVRPVFLHGSENATIPTSRIKAFASTLGADLRIINGAGHSLPFTHWRDTIAAAVD